MPALNFVLPHWIYWSGLLLFPLVAMYLVRRQRRLNPGPRPYLFLAYLLWLCGGFLGLHRFYLKSLLGFLFIPFFLAILWGNSHIRDERENVSRTRAALESTTSDLQRIRERIAAGSRGAADELVPAEREAAAAQSEFDDAAANLSSWQSTTTVLAVVLLAMLLVDAVLIPWLVRKRRRIEEHRPGAPPVPTTPAPPVPSAGTGEDPTMGMRTRYTGWIDTMNQYAGEFVAYWGLLAVFAYYYEVIGRYVFNSPTNWVHESMFLMFGMQYMISGAYGYRDDAHVRVDIFYSRLSARGRAICDIITSVFFFIFTITMLVTGWRFAMDSIGFGEVSFTEWQVQYWPVKLAIPLGAALIVLQGAARLARDISLLRQPREA